MWSFYRFLDEMIEGFLTFLGFLFFITLLSPFVIALLIALHAMWSVILK